MKYFMTYACLILSYSKVCHFKCYRVESNIPSVNDFIGNIEKGSSSCTASSSIPKKTKGTWMWETSQYDSRYGRKGPRERGGEEVTMRKEIVRCVLELKQKRFRLGDMHLASGFGVISSPLTSRKPKEQEILVSLVPLLPRVNQRNRR